jgi:hypothetical protein
MPPPEVTMMRKIDAPFAVAAVVDNEHDDCFVVETDSPKERDDGWGP